MQKELTKMLEELSIKAFLSVESIRCVQENDGKVYRFEITSEEPNIVIGKFGETLFSLQHIFRLMAEKKFPDEEIPHIIVDVDKYRDNQIDNALSITDEFVKRMNELQREKIELPPMASYKRRAVHFHVMEKYPELETESTGFGQERKIVVKRKA